jgi:hypothetical protein
VIECEFAIGCVKRKDMVYTAHTVYAVLTYLRDLQKPHWCETAECFSK